MFKVTVFVYMLKLESIINNKQHNIWSHLILIVEMNFCEVLQRSMANVFCSRKFVNAEPHQHPSHLSIESQARLLRGVQINQTCKSTKQEPVSQALFLYHPNLLLYTGLIPRLIIWIFIRPGFCLWSMIANLSWRWTGFLCKLIWMTLGNLVTVW